MVCLLSCCHIYDISFVINRIPNKVSLRKFVGGIGLCVNTLPWALNERCGKHMVPTRDRQKKKNQKKTSILSYLFTPEYIVPPYLEYHNVCKQKHY